MYSNIDTYSHIHQVRNRYVSLLWIFLLDLVKPAGNIPVYMNNVTIIDVSVSHRLDCFLRADTQSQNIYVENWLPTFSWAICIKNNTLIFIDISTALWALNPRDYSSKRNRGSPMRLFELSPPALLTRMSTPPRLLFTHLNVSLTSASFVTSHFTA